MSPAKLCATASLRVFILLNLSYLPAQYLGIEPEDWQTIPGLGEVTSVSESQDGLYFSHMRGIVFYDYFSNRMSMELRLNHGLPGHEIYQVYVDQTTEAIWIVHEKGISFRLPTDDYWREVPFTALPDFFRGSRVIRVGGSFDGIWVDTDGVYTLLNSFTGSFMRRDLHAPTGIVDWNVGRNEFYNDFDLSQWTGGGDWTAMLHDFLGPDNLTAVPTVSLVDRDGHTWYGTDLGIIFKGDRYSKHLEVYQTGVAPWPASSALLDRNRIWFADNSYRRAGKYLPLQDYFLSTWDETSGRWNHFTGIESMSIRDTHVNRLLKVGQDIWLATMYGILRLDFRHQIWYHTGTQQGLNDPAIWDLAEYNGSVYAATAFGVNRIDVKSKTVIRTDSSALSGNTQVFSLFSTGDELWAGTQLGIYRLGPGDDADWSRVSGYRAIDIWGNEEDIFAVDGAMIYRYDPATDDFGLYEFSSPDGAKIVEINGIESYIWLATSRGILIINFLERKRWTLTVADGLPSDVCYSVLLDDDWAWILTEEGVCRLRWRTYFE